MSMLVTNKHRANLSAVLQRQRLPYTALGRHRHHCPDHSHEQTCRKKSFHLHIISKLFIHAKGLQRYNFFF